MRIVVRTIALSITAALALLCLVFAAAHTLARATTAVEHSASSEPLAETDFNRGSGLLVDSVTVAAGGRAEARVRLTNPGKEWVEIAKIVTSCPCFALELADKQIAPHGTADATATIDLSEDSEFFGELSPEFRCFDAAGCERFVGSLDVRVVPKPDHPPGADGISRSREVVQ